MNNAQRVAVNMKLGKGEAALISAVVSIQYITGFHSSDGFVIVTDEHAFFLIDSRYFTHAKDKVKTCEVVLLTDFGQQTAELFAEHSIKTVYIESERATVSELNKWRDSFKGIDFDATNRLSDVLEKMRIIKTADELKKIEAAQRIAERAFATLINGLRPGMTERQAGLRLDYLMLEYGADALSFDTIAASGPNSAVPHAVPTNRPLQNGDFFTLDFGAVKDGYHSDMTRTVAVGRPSDEMRRVYDAVNFANADGMKAVRAGVSGKLVDSVARGTLDSRGYEKYFGHGLGHGVGLEIHENPRLSPKSRDTLQAGMVVTIEPGVYIPESGFGVRIEDMVVVTENGCVNLTRTEKSLIVI